MKIENEVNMGWWFLSLQTTLKTTTPKKSMYAFKEPPEKILFKNLKLIIHNPILYIDMKIFFNDNYKHQEFIIKTEDPDLRQCPEIV